MKVILPAIFLLLFAASSEAPEYNLLTDTAVYWPAPVLSKPDYLQTITDPTFDTHITRIVGNPGETIVALPEQKWANEQLRHGYSKRQPWNSDQSLIYLDRHDPELWLDGSTYEVLFTRQKPGTRVRWSNYEPNIMYYLASYNDGNSQLGRWDVINDSTEVVIALDGYKELSFGKGEGNFSNDGTKVALSAIRISDNHEVIFITDISTGQKWPDMDMNGVAIEINNATLSPLGNYLVIAGDWGQGADRLQVRNASSGAILYTETNRGMPSHFDVQLDQNGDEVVVGVAKTTTEDVRSGTVIKRILETGTISVIADHKYASHTSGRAVNRPGWVYVTYQNRSVSYPPYINEVVAVKLDGTRTERIAHLHSMKFNYVSEAHAVPSPDGNRVMWASDWDTENYPIQSYVSDFRDKIKAQH